MADFWQKQEVQIAIRSGKRDAGLLTHRWHHFDPWTASNGAKLFRFPRGGGADPAAYLPDGNLISALSPFTTTVVPNGRDKSANRSNM